MSNLHPIFEAICAPFMATVVVEPCLCDFADLCEGGYPCPRINPEDIEFSE